MRNHEIYTCNSGAEALLTNPAICLPNQVLHITGKQVSANLRIDRLNKCPTIIKW